MGEPAGRAGESQSPPTPLPGISANEDPRTAPRRARLLLLVALAVLTLDILSKLIVVATLSDREPLRLLGGLLYLTEARNTGAAFSLAEGATVAFSVVAAVVVVLIVRTAGRIRSTGWAIALGFVLGGAAGNLTDRMLRDPGPLRGGVVDFLSVLDPYGQVWPIFNLADSAVVCGGTLAVLLSVRRVDLDGTRGGTRDGIRGKRGSSR